MTANMTKRTISEEIQEKLLQAGWTPMWHKRGVILTGEELLLNEGKHLEAILEAKEKHIQIIEENRE